MHTEPVTPRQAGTAARPRHTTSPGVIDHHVHLGLVDWRLLLGSAVAEVHDLGWDANEMDRITESLRPTVTVRSLGPFHTAPGGYPVGRSWAPAAAICTLDSRDDVRAAVAAAVERHAHGLKLVLHAGMPLLGDELLGEAVAQAHAAGLRVFAHAEGTGQAERAITAGVDVLVHVPWAKVLGDEVVIRAAEQRMEWISTLSIHDGADLERALENARRFHALGGRLRYGTDLGNGDLPVGVSAREIELLGASGLRGQALHEAVFGDQPWGAPQLVNEAPLPETATELADWLLTATRITPQ